MSIQFNTLQLNVFILPNNYKKFLTFARPKKSLILLSFNINDSIKYSHCVFVWHFFFLTTLGYAWRQYYCYNCWL